MLQSRPDKFKEKRVRSVRAAFKLGMKLNADEKAVLRQLDCFDNPAVRGGAADYEAGLFHKLPVLIVEFVAVAMTLENEIGMISPLKRCRDYFGRGSYPNASCRPSNFVF